MSIPELRNLVFTFLDSRALLKCARVCQAWKDDALRARWRYCDVGMRGLMQQLSPMKEEVDIGNVS